MKAIVRGVIQGVKEAPADFIKPTVSLVRGGLNAGRQIASSIARPGKEPHRERPVSG